MKNYPNIFKLVMVLAALCMMIGAITSCNPQRKINKAKSLLNEHPDEAAKYCAEKFPVKDSTIVRDTTVFDTLYLENEPEVDIRYVNDTVFKTITVPGTTYFVTKTVTKDSIVIRRDIAKETALQAKIDDLIIVNADCIGDRDKAKQKRDWWMWVAIGLGAAWIIKIVLSIWGGKFNFLKGIKLK